MLQYHQDHFYVWGYACLTTLIFVGACIASIRLVRRFPSSSLWILCIGVLMTISSKLIMDLGWLIISRGSDSLDYNEEPERGRIWMSLVDLEGTLSYIGIAVLAISIPLIFRYLSQSQRNKKSAEQAAPSNR